MKYLLNEEEANLVIATGIGGEDPGLGIGIEEMIGGIEGIPEIYVL